jgi:RHS repeat-associated protein
MIRSARPGIATFLIIVFIGGLFPRQARAAETQAEAQPKPEATQATTTETKTNIVEKSATTLAKSVPQYGPYQVMSLPTGADKSGVTSQAISLPQGAGKIQGMGESFSAQLSTGIGTYSVPFSLPAARGAAQPSLGLAYSSAMGHGVAGVGWDVGVPFIARQVDRGIPTYDDPTTGGDWKATQDRFVFNGGQELVPICLVSNSQTCSGALSGEVMPAWSAGYMYFRPRVEGSFLRFFWSPDHQTWRVQDKSGVAMELGVPLDDSTYTDGLERDGAIPGHVFRWNLVRQYDANGDANPAIGAPAPNNVVVYRWAIFSGTGYLTDIYDTPPAVNPTAAALSDYAHHTRLTYDMRTDPTVSYRRGYKTEQLLRLKRVDVASKTFGNAPSRVMVRRYALSYDSNWHPSLLSSVQLEGQCSSPTYEDGKENIAYPSNCPTLPALTFGYQHVDGYTTNNKPQLPDLTGYEAFDDRIHTMSNSPKHSIDETLTDLFDINADGLPDVLTTAPGLYNGNDAVFFNGSGGTADKFANATMMAVNGVLGANAGTITLDNPNVSEHDVDGDGIVNLLHMPQLQKYAVYTPTYSSSGWSWDGRVIATASQQNVKVDFQNNRADIKVMDVNGDGLVDVVYSSATEYDTFLSLGRYPAGDGQYGHASWSGASTATISNDPLTACAEWSGSPVRLSDDDVRIGDMNGDGLPDIVRIRKGDIKYWPGRGNGFWGTGSIDDCPANSYGQGRDIAMTNSPYYSDPDLTEVRLDDVNGDGLDDIVQIRYNSVDVWLNVDGVGFTSSRHTASGTPVTPLLNIGRARLVDINGSGTRDLLWGNGYNYQYADLSGGSRPWVLTHVDNGLGKTTTINYTTSTQQMLAAEAANNAWSRKMPAVVHIVASVIERDNLGVVGRPDGVYTTSYEYRDPAYDGQQREFHGFTTARATRLGDANSPTATTESTFLLGDCLDETPNDNIDECALAERWRENPREALKGLPVVSETFDTTGVYLSTTHNTYRLRQLYQGLDGRVVRQAFHEQTDAYVYDDGPFQSTPTTTTLPETNLELSLGQPTTDSSRTVTVRSSARGHTRSSTQLDDFGNATDALSEGCVDGCVATDETITNHTTPGRRTDDASGWLYKTVETYVVGSLNPTVKRQDRFTSYDVAGNPVEMSADLNGSLALDRFHESNKTVAAAPITASQDGTITISSQTYDALGNLTAQSAPNGRCRTIVYDSPFAQLPTTETVYVGPQSGSCGSVALQAMAAYDRGLGVATDVQDIHNELTHVTYDGLGRLTSLYKPDPNQTSTLSARPSLMVEYFLTTNPSTQPYSLIHTQTQDGSDPAVNSYRNAWAYVDGMGRAIVTLDQADPTAGDGGDFVVNGLTDYDQRGAVQRAYLAWFYSGSAASFPLNIAPTTKSSRQRYDAFGRVLERYSLDGTLALRNVYHALSQDTYDAADLSNGPHAGTYATTRQDGHGRVVAMTERVHAGMSLEARQTSTTYLPSGEPIVITRQRGSDSVVRWMRYDSLGRLVLNVEPNVTKNFSPAPSTDPTSMKAWRYAYDDNCDLVGTSDSRGCGVNYDYDAGGRILAEDYSPCLEAQQPYSAPDYQNLTGFEVYYYYDFADPDTTNIPNFTVDSSLLRGRLVSVSDRASKTLTRFDGRGRVTGIARRVANPGTPDDALASRYAPRWYTEVATFDGADRPLSQSTGAHVTELLGANQESLVTTDYTKRGTVRDVGSSYGDLVTHVYHDADGLPTQIEYGDLARTTTDFGHDDRRRVRTVQTYRGPPTAWTSPPNNYSPAPDYGGTTPSTFQLVLENAEFTYDEVDNPTEIHDWRTASDWPTGAKPVTRKAQYDDLYRLTRVDYQYSSGDDTWVDPFENEDSGQNTDPRRAPPSPHVSFDKRILSQSYQYDWLGNITQSKDDAAGFYDRSLGGQTHSSTHPYQLTQAVGDTSSRDGSLTVAYDDAGNMTSMALARSGACVPSTAVCSQRFVYDWDEVGRLARARRWDLSSAGTANDPVPSATPTLDLTNAYDASDKRVRKTGTDASLVTSYTVYVFASLELRQAAFTSGDYDDATSTEVPYLVAHGVRLARLHYSADSLPTLTSGKLHVLFELIDHLGSSTSIIDRETSELVEDTRYTAAGASNGDYRPSRWDSFREDYQFTGKEEDVEVGITYFGKRFLSTQLNRWLSPDPVAIQAPGSSDFNIYAYIRGALLRAIDPLGLQDMNAQAQLAVAQGIASPNAPQSIDTLLALQNVENTRCQCSADLNAVTNREAANFARGALQHDTPPVTALGVALNHASAAMAGKETWADAATATASVTGMQALRSIPNIDAAFQLKEIASAGLLNWSSLGAAAAEHTWNAIPVIPRLTLAISRVQDASTGGAGRTGAIGDAVVLGVTGVAELFAMRGGGGELRAPTTVDRQTFSGTKVPPFRFGSGRPPNVADVTIYRNGQIVFADTIQSGNMTPGEAALGFPKKTLATHTEARTARGVTFPFLEAGDTVIMEGDYKPCNSCKGAMNRAAVNTGAQFFYLWEDQMWNTK